MNGTSAKSPSRASSLSRARRPPRAPAPFSPDPAENRRSARRVAALMPALVCLRSRPASGRHAAFRRVRRATSRRLRWPGGKPARCPSEPSADAFEITARGHGPIVTKIQTRVRLGGIQADMTTTGRQANPESASVLSDRRIREVHWLLDSTCTLYHHRLVNGYPTFFLRPPQGPRRIQVVRWPKQPLLERDDVMIISHV